jgi:predicted dehydrogenase
MENGVPTSSFFSQGTGQANEIEVYGESGRLTATPHSAPRVLPVSTRPWTLDAKLRDLGSAIDLPHAVRTRREGGFFVAPFAAQWRQFAVAVRGGAPVEVGVDSARRLLQTMLAAAESTHTGRPIRRAEAPRALAPASAESASPG